MGSVASSIGQCSGCQSKQKHRRTHGRTRNGQSTENFTLLAYYNNFIASNAAAATSVSQHRKEFDYEYNQSGPWPRTVNGYHKAFSDKHLTHPSGDTAFFGGKNELCSRPTNEIRPSFSDDKNESCEDDHNHTQNLELNKNVMRDEKPQNNNLTVSNKHLPELDCFQGKYLII